MATIMELGQAVRTAAADLPLPGTAQALERFDEARATLTQALTDSVEPAGLPHLNRAQTHLDRAVTQLMAAAEHLDEYLVAIGLSPTAPKGDAGPAPVAAAPAPVADGSRSWWLARVDEITQADDDNRAKADTEIRHKELTPLFDTLVKAAAGSDRGLYRRELHATDPAVGVRLPALTWPRVRILAAELTGGTPTAKNLDTVRAKTADAVRRLLPGLDDKAGEIELAAACHVARAPERHPVDIAAIGPVLVAALTAALGRS